MILLRFAFFLCLLCSALPSLAADKELANAQNTQQKVKEASLSIFNRDIIVFRASVLGIEPVDRVTRAQKRIEQQISPNGRHKVTAFSMPPGMLIQIDGAGSFYIAPDDIDQFQQETLEGVAKDVVTKLSAVVLETQESRSVENMLRAAAYVLVASIVFIVLVWGVQRLRRLIEARILSFASAKLDGLDLVHAKLINRERTLWILHRLFQLLLWVIVFLLTYQWLSLVMSQFPFTRPWGEHLNSFLFNLVANIGSAILKAIPDVFTALVIFFLAKLVNQGLSGIFDSIQNGALRVSWLDADLVRPTRRITSTAVWLFALAMAYPYLPGAGTEAFKGVSVLVGLMISLGASSLIGQAASGLILTYSRVYRKGEFIHVLEHEGTITEMGMFTTRIRNGMGVELTMPNSLVLGNVTKNYSRVVQGQGFVVDTKVTIGYDTPWRQVHAMLIQAALRTPGVLTEPTPKVFQTALSDFYPEYLLICQAVPSEPRPRAEVMNLLHANIQDVFNEYGVQIMSPHYLGDPAQEKLVAKEDWNRAPAAK
ncbi:mechanosensitive ion channel domain-containing protein [Undibacterium sp.]|uniref:mechanosensitive ion channel family protein n=1 Tax=Undibacterium sp. TaxID=1914977 RepID=UPI0025D1564F|nr:mechanosensitive ion channel domain-containing protein [Undibacterium sp.]